MQVSDDWFAVTVHGKNVVFLGNSGGQAHFSASTFLQGVANSRRKMSQTPVCERPRFAKGRHSSRTLSVKKSEPHAHVPRCRRHGGLEVRSQLKRSETARASHAKGYTQAPCESATLTKASRERPAVDPGDCERLLGAGEPGRKKRKLVCCVCCVCCLPDGQAQA